MISLTSEERKQGYKLLFDGDSLNGWDATMHPESWIVEDESIHCTAEKRGGILYTLDQYEDFVLSMDYKTEPDVNSGIFYRLSDLEDHVHTGFEIQILDTYGKETMGKNDSGAVYDLLAPSKNAVFPAGEWNHIIVECKQNITNIILNGITIIEMDINQWDTAGQNPDGSENKFKYAWRDMPRRGHIALQNHGGRIWVKNVKLLAL